MALVFAAAWLLGLLAAAPALRTSARYATADRLRDALLLGAGIPFVLGLFGALSVWACWAALAICVTFAYLRQPAPEARSRRSFVPYLTIVTLAALAWPPVMRPLLDGDSLSYHLPTAAAWAHAHGLWTADTRYWWYPPGSELFASALFTVAGPFALPWCGVGALALIGFRLAAFARVEFELPALAADALAAATIAVAPLAVQAGTLQNDVWLAAFFLESLWALRHDRTAATRAMAMTCMLKPVGWIFAAVAGVTGRASRSTWLTCGAVLLLWAVRDAVLWRSALIDPATTFVEGGVTTTILAHGPAGIGLLARVALTHAPFGFIALLAALAGPLLAPRRLRLLGWAAFVAFAIYLVLPRAYADAQPQLATGVSLRYAAPAIVLGALLLARLVRRRPKIATAALLGCAAFGIWQSTALFWNDAPTRLAIPIALVALAEAIVTVRRGARWVAVAGIALAILASGAFAARQPALYYRDAFAVDGRPANVYLWIERARPARAGGWGLPIGTVNVLVPQALTIDLPDAGACRAAARRAAMLIAVAQSERPDAINRNRLAAARTCGAVRYDDGIAVAALPLGR